MGNQLRKEYEIEDQPIGSGGLGLHWKIYNAVNIKTRDEVSIFILDKKAVPIRKSPYYDIFRRDINIAATCRHNDVLCIVKDASKLESSSQLAFVSERIQGSLADFVQCPNNTAHEHTTRRKLKLGELRLKLGITQILSALDYLHGARHDNKAPMAHGFIDLCNIYVARNGDWKLMGFSFAHELSTAHSINLVEFTFGRFDVDSKHFAFLPTLNCLAPEIYRHAQIGTKSDVFALCRVVYLVYLYFADQLHSTQDVFLSTLSEYQTFIATLEGAPQLLRSQIDDRAIAEMVAAGLHGDAKERADVRSLLASAVTQNVNVKIIRYLEELEGKERAKKIGFISKLSGAVASFSYDVIIDKMMPSLLRQLQIAEMQTHVLPLVFQLMYIDIESSDFQRLIMPRIEPLFDAHPSSALFEILGKNIGIVTAHCTAEQRQGCVARLYAKCLQLRFHIAMQKIVLSELGTAIANDWFETQTLLHILMPVLGAILCERKYNDQLPTLTTLRVNVLMLFSKMFGKLSEAEVVKHVLEPTRALLVLSPSPPILMSALGVYQAIVHGSDDHRYVNIIAYQLIPTCAPLYMSKNLNAKQCAFCMKLMRTMMEKLQSYKEERLQLQSPPNATTTSVTSPSRSRPSPKSVANFGGGDGGGGDAIEFSKARKDTYADVADAQDLQLDKTPRPSTDIDPDREIEITPYPTEHRGSLFSTTAATQRSTLKLPPGHDDDGKSNAFFFDPYAAAAATTSHAKGATITQIANDDTWANFDADPGFDVTIDGASTPITEITKIDSGSKNINATTTTTEQPKQAQTQDKNELASFQHFGRFSMDTGAWGSMHVDKQLFADFDFGDADEDDDDDGKTDLAEEKDMAVAQTVTAEMSNPFAMGSDDEEEDEDEVTVVQQTSNRGGHAEPHDNDNPFAVRAVGQVKAKDTHNGFGDPFKDLFG